MKPTFLIYAALAILAVQVLSAPLAAQAKQEQQMAFAPVQRRRSTRQGRSLATPSPAMAALILQCCGTTDRRLT